MPLRYTSCPLRPNLDLKVEDVLSDLGQVLLVIIPMDALRAKLVRSEIFCRPWLLSTELVLGRSHPFSIQLEQLSAVLSLQSYHLEV